MNHLWRILETSMNLSELQSLKRLQKKLQWNLFSESPAIIVRMSLGRPKHTGSVLRSLHGMGFTKGIRLSLRSTQPASYSDWSAERLHDSYAEQNDYSSLLDTSSVQLWFRCAFFGEFQLVFVMTRLQTSIGRTGLLPATCLWLHMPRNTFEGWI